MLESFVLRSLVYFYFQSTHVAIMFTEILTLAFFTTSVLGTNIYAPVHDFGAMLRRGDAILKRQGYYPTTHLCGEGETCAEACGATYVQCPSTSGTYCYDPAVGDHCCRDGSGSQSYPPFYPSYTSRYIDMPIQTPAASATTAPPTGFPTPTAAQTVSTPPIVQPRTRSLFL